MIQVVRARRETIMLRMSLSNMCFSAIKNVEAEAHLLNWTKTVSTQNKASDRGK